MATETQPRATEKLPASVISEKAHSAIINLATRLLATPEFTDAAARHVFGRSTHPDVHFQKGDHIYRIYYKAEPNRFEPKYIQNYDVSMRLSVTKYDLKEPIGDGSFKKVGSVSLYTYFTEDRDGVVISYRGGNMQVSDGTKESSNTPETINRIAEVLPDFYQQMQL